MRGDVVGVADPQEDGGNGVRDRGCLDPQDRILPDPVAPDDEAIGNEVRGVPDDDLQETELVVTRDVLVIEHRGPLLVIHVSVFATGPVADEVDQFTAWRTLTLVGVALPVFLDDLHRLFVGGDGGDAGPEFGGAPRAGEHRDRDDGSDEDAGNLHAVGAFEDIDDEGVDEHEGDE